MKHVVFVMMFFVTGVLAAAADKPNIVLILADDLGYGELGCYDTSCLRSRAWMELLAPPFLSHFSGHLRVAHFSVSHFCGFRVLSCSERIFRPGERGWIWAIHSPQVCQVGAA